MNLDFYKRESRRKRAKENRKNKVVCGGALKFANALGSWGKICMFQPGF